MFKQIETFFFQLFQVSGGSTLLVFQALMEIRFSARDISRILKQMVVIGVQSFPLAVMIGFFTGMIFSLNFGIPLKSFGAEDNIGGILGVAMIRTLGPVFTAFILAARIGSAMTAEIATMSVSNEIDSMRVMGIKPVRFLVMPRILASIIVNPVLTVYSCAAGLVGGWLLARAYLDVTDSTYWNQVFLQVDVKEIQTGFIKTFVFAIIYSSICVYQGLITKGGAAGVGKSTTRAVVYSLTMILVADFLITRFMFG